MLEAQAYEAAMLEAQSNEAAFLEAQAHEAARLSMMQGDSSPSSRQARQSAFSERPNPRFCVHWQQGRCNYGDGCRFSHACPGGSGGGATVPPPGQANAAGGTA